MNDGLGDYALMKNARGRYVLGHGPFLEEESYSGEGTAFYVNDFALSDEKPWKVPSRVEYFDKLTDGADQQNDRFECSWIEPELTSFAQVFSEVNGAIGRGEIQKSVPVAVERGKLVSGELKQLVFSSNTHPLLNGYAWCVGERGFCGLTPEVLFSYEKGRLKTMALAGTASLEEKEVFSVDEKEIREHEFVVQTLVSKLNEIGMVQPESRTIMELDSLVHFHTPMFVGLYDATSVGSLVKRLHPTPALGPLPRTQKSMEDLLDWRERLGCPAHFGAPMGVFDGGEFHSVVCIRGVHWDGEDVLLPAGCGVIEASRLTNEWRELQLKRESVKKLFGL